MRTRVVTTDDVQSWSQVGDQEVFVSDLIDKPTHPDARMTVGYARVGRGESLEVSFPYDEVLIVTKGVFSILAHTGETGTARAGDVIYLPAHSANTYRADESAEMVYVANPPEVYAEHVAQAAASG